MHIKKQIFLCYKVLYYIFKISWVQFKLDS